MKITGIIIAFIFASGIILAQEAGDSLSAKINYYKQRYKADCLDEKITNNYGKGFEALYGTRNMKTILYGIAYRGGANNYYHKTDKRDNHNPLPEDGLDNLAEEGFSSAVYLYSKNFSKSKHEVISNGDTLKYYQMSGNDRKSMYKILSLVAGIISEPKQGPIYLHCWNGWHQSGYVAAAILMQFCDFTNEMALDYWIENTDGASKGYDNVKDRIREFVPFEDLKIDDKLKEEICPCLKSKE